MIFTFWLGGVVCSCNETATQQHPVSEEQSSTSTGSHMKMDSVAVTPGEFLSTLDESLAFYDSAALRKADVCHYRLPDNEAWEFFYSIQKSYGSEYGEYGNLVPYHKKTKKTTLLNVFNEVGGDIC